VDGTGSGSCPVVGFGISGAEPSGSIAGRYLIIFTNCVWRLLILVETLQGK
jgi:hypothetical protein